MLKNVAVRKLGTRQIVVIGMLSAVSVIMGMAGFGFIPLPTVKATIMHLPVIIGAIIEGPVVGGLIGLIFGLFSIYQNIVSPTPVSFVFLNPLVSVVPRVLIGITAYYSYNLFSGKREVLKAGVGAAVGSLTNTVAVLAMIYFLYGQKYAAAKEIDPEKVAAFIGGIAVMNGIPEAIIAILVVVPLVIALKKIRK